MMMVSTNEYVLYTCTLYCNIYFLFPKELLVHWARDVYEFNESQMTATVELVTNSTFEVGQVSILGFPRQIPDGDPNRFPALFVPGPSFSGEVKQPSMCILLTLDTQINLYVSDVHTFAYVTIPNSFYLRACL